MPGLIKTLRRLEYANYLIKKRATGSLETFAYKMNLSEQSVKNLLSEMRELGAKVSYDRKEKTYFYEEQGEFSISKFFPYGEKLSREEISKIGNAEDLCFSEKAIFILCKDL